MKKQPQILWILLLAMLNFTFVACSNIQTSHQDIITNGEQSENFNHIDGEGSRIYTEHGFSVATTQQYTSQDMLILGDSQQISFAEKFYSLLKTAIVNKILYSQSHDGMSLNESQTIIENQAADQLIYLVEMKLAFSKLIDYNQLANLSSENLEEEVAEILENYILIEENTLIFNGVTVTQNIVKVSNQEQVIKVYNVFTFPYKDSSSIYCDVVFLNENIDASVEIATMVNSFVYDDELVVINDDGKSKFLTHSFSAYTDQNYVKDTVLFPHLRNSFGEIAFLSSQFHLNCVDANLKNAYIDTDLVYWSEYDSQSMNSKGYYSAQEVVGENEFTIYYIPVNIKDENGEIFTKDLVVGFTHDTDKVSRFSKIKGIENFKTTIFLNLAFSTSEFDTIDFEVYNFTKTDYDIINNLFRDVIQSYESELSDSALQNIEMHSFMGW